ncbi:hypothetical protein, partial [Klebsiella michiganensis]
GTFPGLRRKRLTRATGPQTVMNRSPAKRSASRVEAAAMPRRGTFPGCGVNALPGLPARRR